MTCNYQGGMSGELPFCTCQDEYSLIPSCSMSFIARIFQTNSQQAIILPQFKKWRTSFAGQVDDVDMKCEGWVIQILLLHGPLWSSSSNHGFNIYKIWTEW
jgi:hypothetical protein